MQGEIDKIITEVAEEYSPGDSKRAVRRALRARLGDSFTPAHMQVLQERMRQSDRDYRLQDGDYQELIDLMQANERQTEAEEVAFIMSILPEVTQ